MLRKHSVVTRLDVKEIDDLALGNQRKIMTSLGQVTLLSDRRTEVAVQCSDCKTCRIFIVSGYAVSGAIAIVAAGVSYLYLSEEY